MTRKVTIKDVARHAGCGIATVSRVLNETGPASADTRERVLKAAKALQFQFSDIGRSLQSNTTKTIGCVVPSLANPVFADAVQGLQDVLRQAGYQLLLACSNYDAEQEAEAIQTLLAKQVDGLVLTVSDAANSEGLQTVRQRSIPCCLMFNEAVDHLPSASIDNFAAAKVVANAFAEAGHVETGFLALRFKTSDRARRRFEGFAAACQEHGMVRPALLQIDEADGDLTALLSGLLSENTRLSGLFASNDFVALAAINAARSLGRNVPQDLSVVGFDGIALGRMVQPSLATVESNSNLMGSDAAQIVLSAVNAQAMPSPQNPRSSYRFRAGDSLAPRQPKT